MPVAIEDHVVFVRNRLNNVLETDTIRFQLPELRDAIKALQSLEMRLLTEAALNNMRNPPKQRT
jgi:hypothetical protein